MSRLALLLPALLLLVAGPVQAAPQAELCVDAARRAARETGVPLRVLLALTLTETGRRAGSGAMQPWPWALNRGGESLWFETRKEALAYLSAALEEGTTNIDIGCFQLNWRWHAKGFASVEEMIDPVPNALYAARHVAALHAETGSWKAAAAAYHSFTPEYAERYLARFEPIYAALGKGAPEEIELAAAEPAAPRVNAFPLLQAGAARSDGSLVPLDAAARPLFGG